MNTQNFCIRKLVSHVYLHFLFKNTQVYGSDERKSIAILYGILPVSDVNAPALVENVSRS